MENAKSIWENARLTKEKENEQRVNDILVTCESNANIAAQNNQRCVCFTVFKEVNVTVWNTVKAELERAGFLFPILTSNEDNTKHTIDFDFP